MNFISPISRENLEFTLLYISTLLMKEGTPKTSRLAISHIAKLRSLLTLSRIFSLNRAKVVLRTFPRCASIIYFGLGNTVQMRCKL